MDLEPFIHLISFSGWLLLDKGNFPRYRCDGIGHQIMSGKPISRTRGAWILPAGCPLTLAITMQLLSQTWAGRAGQS